MQRFAPATMGKPVSRGPTRSVAALLAEAGERELVVKREWLEPRFDAGLLVRVPTEVGFRPGRGHRDPKVVLAHTQELHVVTVMRAVVRDHRHQSAAQYLARALLRDLVVNVEIWDERAVRKAVWVVALRLEVGLQ